MKIGELAERSGVTPKTVRYYESIGLLPAPERSASGYRAYAESDVARLQFVGKAKLLGLSLGDVGDILRASEGPAVNCEHVLALLEAKRDQIDEWMREAAAFRDVLSETIRASRDDLSDRSTGEYRCPVIERGLHERALRVEGTTSKPPARPALADAALAVQANG